MSFLFDYFILFGIRPSFHIKGSKLYHTILSELISYISIIIIIFFIIFYGIELFKRKNVSIIRTTYSDQFPTPINLSHNFFFPFSLQYQNYTNYVNESIYYVTANYINIKYDDNGNEILNKTPIPIITCDKINFTILKEDYKALPLSQLYCLDNPKDLILQGDYGRKYWDYLSFSFNFCDENNNKNIKCENKNKIIELLKGGYFGMFISDTIIEPLNLNKPVILNVLNQFTTISSVIYKDYWVYFRTNEIKTDSNLFFDTIKKETCVGFDKTSEHTDMRNIDSNFMSMLVRGSSERYVYTRNYRKFASVAADISGIIKVLFFIGDSLVFLFENIYYKFYLLSFFDIKFNEKKMKFTKKFSSNINIYYSPISKDKNFIGDNFSVNNAYVINNNKNDNIDINTVSKNNKNIISDYSENKYNLDYNNKSNKSICKIGLIFPNFKFHNRIDYSNELKFRTLLSIIFCKKKKKIVNKYVENIYNNIKIYFEIIRFFKLYNDVEKMKKEFLNYQDFNRMENNYLFSLNSEKTTNFFNSNFKNIFQKISNFSFQNFNNSSQGFT